MVPVVLLLLLTGVRVVVAAVTPLAADEAYYWVWSRVLQPGYLDHPPMVSLWIRAGTALCGDTLLGVRLLGPFAAALGSILIVDVGNRLFPAARPGLAAAVLLNATLMLGAGAVTSTPDTPLLFFATLMLWATVRAGADERWWLLAGASAGLALDSKYTAVLLAAAVPLWLAWTRQWRLFRSPWLWAGGAVAVGLFAPVAAWNAAHGWAGFIKQGGRTADWHPERALEFLGELLGAQIALATPLIFGLFAAGLWRSCAGGLRGDRAAALLAAFTVPGLLLFVQHALGDRVQANWLAILYPPLAIAGAAVGVRWWRAAAGLGFAMTALVYLQAAAAPLPLPRRLDPTLIRLAGWDELAREADALRARLGAAYLASEDYGQASLLAWWAPRGTEVVGAEQRWAYLRLPRGPEGAGLLLISERRREGPDPILWREAREVGHLVRSRAGVEAEAFRVYLVRHREGPAAVLPRPGGE